MKTISQLTNKELVEEVDHRRTPYQSQSRVAIRRFELGKELLNRLKSGVITSEEIDLLHQDRKEI